MAAAWSLVLGDLGCCSSWGWVWVLGELELQGDCCESEVIGISCHQC